MTKGLQITIQLELYNAEAQETIENDTSGAETLEEVVKEIKEEYAREYGLDAEAGEKLNVEMKVVEREETHG